MFSSDKNCPAFSALLAAAELWGVAGAQVGSRFAREGCWSARGCVPGMGQLGQGGFAQPPGQPADRIPALAPHVCGVPQINLLDII